MRRESIREGVPPGYLLSNEFSYYISYSTPVTVLHPNE